MIDEREYKQTKKMESLDHKKHRVHDLQKTFLEKLHQIEKKREEKEASINNTKSVFGQFNTQKKEIS